MTKTTESAINWPSLSIDLLNDIFSPLSFKRRLELLYKYFDKEDVLVTTSCGTKSVFLLHLIHRIQPEQKVHFVNTTFHFPETISYKELLSNRFHLDIVDVCPNAKDNQRTRTQKMWQNDPDGCCAINKVKPLEPLKQQHKIWISGLMKHQTNFRAGLNVFELDGNILKFHPNIDVAEATFEQYLNDYDLPRHPLEADGFGSVGCTHCTAKGKGREGRWKGQQKTECGLHPDYFRKKLAQVQSM